ncbi:DUF4148 domain-containing protein [Bordetella genomosp. 4]|uniref:DUF4148 domain-containing protein n=1 Tax=Bordetella genomosp. 4 TaxID=463044 RepID=A0A261TU11_9BORD|nr:DUF4148 domain-containing protein [Bordetella genomosp. 4]OZI45224.1 hypothetical protein CAL21_16070 [Bordetella genomosp. 4]OZI53119.1 hypothetical protein CAL20_19170 [Bordetella genomosp. 4]
MKTIASVLLISASLAGTAAYAAEPSGELDYPPTITQTSQLTRAQVIAELQQARAAGQVTFGDIDEPVTQVAASTVTRAQVHAEAVQANAHGPVAFDGEGYPNTGA